MGRFSDAKAVPINNNVLVNQSKKKAGEASAAAREAKTNYEVHARDNDKLANKMYFQENMSRDQKAKAAAEANRKWYQSHKAWKKRYNADYYRKNAEYWRKRYDEQKEKLRMAGIKKAEKWVEMRDAGDSRDANKAKRAAREYDAASDLEKYYQDELDAIAKNVARADNDYANDLQAKRENSMGFGKAWRTGAQSLKEAGAGFLNKILSR